MPKKDKAIVYKKEKNKFRKLVRAAYLGDQNAMRKVENLCAEEPDLAETAKKVVASLQVEMSSGRMSKTDYGEMKNSGRRPYKN